MFRRPRNIPLTAEILAEGNSEEFSSFLESHRFTSLVTFLPLPSYFRIRISRTVV